MSGTSLFWKALLAAGIVGIGGLTSCRQSQNGKSLEEMANVPSYHSHTPASAAENVEQEIEGEYRLVVSLHKLKLYVLINDSVIKEFPVAVGAFETPTPQGEYFILDKVKDPDWHFPKKMLKLWKDYPGGKIPAGDPRNPIRLYWVELREAGNPGKNVSFGIHGTNKQKSIPDWASMGCIRMTDEGIRYIAAQIPNGSRVTIMESFVPQQQADYR